MRRSCAAPPLRGARVNKRIHLHRLGDVLQVLLTAILSGDINFATHLVIGRARQANTTRLGDPLQSRRHIDAVAHEVAIVLHDHVTEIDADAELDALVRCQTGIAVSHSSLHFDRRTHCIHNRGELD